MIFYKRYMGSYASKTAHLTLTERGAYDAMLDHYYATETPLPADIGALYRIVGAMNGLERKAVESVASQFLPVSDDGLRHNERADEEIRKHQAQAATNRELGKRGGRPKKTESVSQSVIESVNETEPNHNPSYSQKLERTKDLSPSCDGFLEFWTAWPKHFRKAARAKCEAVWRRKNLSLKAGEIIAHVTSMKTRWSDPQFIPAPLVYLNGEKWDGAELASTEPKFVAP